MNKEKKLTLIDINLNDFQSLFNKVNLGNILFLPQKISGGFLHKIYKIETNDKNYALKILNPEIVKRKGVLKNINNGEILALKIKKFGINTSTAMFYNNSSIIEYKNLYFMIFDWLDGENYASKKISVQDCIKIGKTVSKLHNLNLDTKKESRKIKPLEIDWRTYLNKSKSENFYNIFNTHSELLEKVTHKVNNSIKDVKLKEILSHRDLDPKNWININSHPYIIDWEATGYINPSLELLDIALAWSGYEENIDINLFSKLIFSYQENTIIELWEDILYSVCINRLEWLEYNIKRALDVELMDTTEKDIAINEIFKSLKSFYNYYNLIPKLEAELHKIVFSKV